MTAKINQSSFWKGAIALLGAMALILCVIMTWHSLTGGQMIGCAAGSSCDKVLSSRWSYVLGILPLSGLALGIYAATLVAAIFLITSKDEELLHLLWMVMLVLAGAILGSAVWFISLQKWVVHAFCPYCMSAHIIGIVLSGVIIWQGVKALRHNKSKMGLWCLLLGFLLAGCLAVTQYLTTPKNMYEQGATNESLPAIDLAQTPVLGSKDAQYVVNVLFDYQCTHCRHLHLLLEELVAQQPQRWAFALCASPLSPSCNPYIPSNTNDSFAGSCDLAKYALALWKTDIISYNEFEKWWFQTDQGQMSTWRPASIEEARAKAVELIGEQALSAALQEGWIETRLLSFTQLFGRTTNKEKSAIPRLVYGNQWVMPDVSDVAGLVEVMQSAFELSSRNCDSNH